MSTLRRRLADIEEREVVRDYIESRRQFEGRSVDELQFFAVYGCFPDALEGELPRRQEYTVGGIRTIITAERICPSSD
jgi:hypothetical protein